MRFFKKGLNKKMGAFLPQDARLRGFFNTSEATVRILVDLLVENYKDGNLLLGSNAHNKIKKRYSCFSLTDSEFENVFLDLKYYYEPKRNSFGYGLYVISLYDSMSENPIKMEICLDDLMIDKFPEEMKEELSNKLYEV